METESVREDREREGGVEHTYGGGGGGGGGYRETLFEGTERG